MPGYLTVKDVIVDMVQLSVRKHLTYMDLICSVSASFVIVKKFSTPQESLQDRGNRTGCTFERKRLEKDKTPFNK